MIEQDAEIKHLTPDYIRAIGQVGAVTNVLHTASTFRDDRPLAVFTQLTQDIRKTTESWFTGDEDV